MKLATLRDGGAADGRLVVVSRDLTRCSDARHLAPTLQAALDDWERVAPQLELVARGVETGGQPVERFHERDALSPLPCPRGTNGGGAFVEPRGAIRLAEGASGIAVAAGLAAITGAVPAGASAEVARAAVRLVMLAGEPAAGDGATAFSPVAVTPDELEWSGGRPRGRLIVDLNGNPFTRADPGADLVPDLGVLVAEAAGARPLAAGGIVGPGPAEAGQPSTVPLRAGDTIRIELRDAEGHSVFGAIEQTVA